MHVPLVRMMNVAMACDQYISATVYQGLCLGCCSTMTIALQSCGGDIVMTITAACLLCTYNIRQLPGVYCCVAKKAGWLLNTNEECKSADAPHWTRV